MEWSQPTYAQFAKDMLAAAFEVVEHKGRKFYHGPAVVVDNVTDVTAKTTVSCTWSEQGSKWVVHPFTETVAK